MSALQSIESNELFFTQKEKFALLNRIDRIPGMQNVRVAYFDGIRLIEIRPHPPMCMKNTLSLIIRPVTRQETVQITQPPVKSKQAVRLYQEIFSTSLSCGAAALSWIVVGGSASAIPISGGASSAITILSYGAATASTLQCGNSLFRLYNETDYGDAKVNQWLDSQSWYQQTTASLDVISVAGGVASAGATLKMVLNLKSAGTPIKEALKGLSRQQRKRLTEELIRIQNPSMSNGTLKALIAAGIHPKRFGKIEIRSAIRRQIRDAISASLSFSGSATSGVIRNPQSIPNIAIALVEEFESY